MADVDKESRLSQAQLQQGDEAVAAGENLRLSLAVAQDPECLLEVTGPDIVELAGDHRAAALLPTSWGYVGPSPRRAQSVDDLGAGGWAIGLGIA